MNWGVSTNLHFMQTLNVIVTVTILHDSWLFKRMHPQSPLFLISCSRCWVTSANFVTTCAVSVARPHLSPGRALQGAGWWWWLQLGTAALSLVTNNFSAPGPTFQERKSERCGEENRERGATVATWWGLASGQWRDDPLIVIIAWKILKRVQTECSDCSDIHPWDEIYKNLEKNVSIMSLSFVGLMWEAGKCPSAVWLILEYSEREYPETG